MFKFTYWTLLENNEQHQLFECEADDILVADQEFQTATGIDVQTASYGCTLSPIE